MKKDVFITGLASFFPNSPVSNDEMEEFLGLISGKHSKVQRIVLKQNGIKRRYYALNKNQEITHTNAEMAMLAIRKLLALTNKSQKDIELLACATATPDQILPSHASMVHGLWEEPVEIFSSAGVCLSCLQALKIAYLSIAGMQYAAHLNWCQQCFYPKTSISNMKDAAIWVPIHIWLWKRTSCALC